MRTIKFYLQFLMIVALLFSSCKIPQQAQQKPLLQMPGQFVGNNNTDTSGIAVIKWKEFFNDQYLTALIDTALINNWDVQVALQKIKQAQADVLLNKAALKPVVDAALTPSVSKFGEYTMNSAGNKGTEIYKGQNIPTQLADFFVGLQTSWEADLWGKLANKRKAAVARFLETAEGKNIVITNLVADIAAAYFELQWYDQSLSIIDSTIDLQKNALSLAKVQKEAGAATALGVKQFEAQLLSLNSMRLETVQEINITENAINLMVGRYPQAIKRSTAPGNNLLSITKGAGLPSALLLNRPDIRQAAFELEATHADVKSARAAFYPSLNITAGLGLQAFKPGLLFNAASLTYNALGNLTAPLMNKMAIRAAFDKASSVQVEAMYDYQKAIVNGYVEVYNELLRIDNLQQLMTVKSQEVNTLVQSVEISGLLFQSSRANYLDILFAQQAALQTKLQLAETRKDQLLAGVNLYKALGGGWR